MPGLTRRRCLGVCMGGAAAALGVGHGHPALPDRGWRAGAPRWAVADRSAQEVVLLDSELFVAGRLECPAPVRLSAGPAGLWVGIGLEGRASGAHGVARVEAGSWGVEVFAYAGPLRALCAGVDGGASWLEGGACPVLVRVDALGNETARTPIDGLQLATQHDGVITRTSAGELLALGPGGAARAMARLGAPATDFALTPDGGCWVLAGGSVWALDGELHIRRRRAFGPLAALAAAGADGAWLLAGDGRRVTRLDRLGRRGPWRALPLRATRLLAGGDGGVLAVNDGALARLDPAGRILPGQGGFGYVADVSGVDCT